ncbi:hypothetical protein TL08_09150 [Actinoalloteichus hymeniacidonis]|uniref:Uncharacterized protein n=2 Tax=Actinoalloteichus hymeniacidonis TaxID=340345 RepID=A0AAC9HQC6_9PSEU|nr:hypothetical protein TL08_09150 [Actinoalloteichus hymeniacidonis]
MPAVSGSSWSTPESVEQSAEQATTEHSKPDSVRSGSRHAAHARPDADGAEEQPTSTTESSQDRLPSAHSGSQASLASAHSTEARGGAHSSGGHRGFVPPGQADVHDPQQNVAPRFGPPTPPPGFHNPADQATVAQPLPPPTPAQGFAMGAATSVPPSPAYQPQTAQPPASGPVQHDQTAHYGQSPQAAQSPQTAQYGQNAAHPPAAGPVQYGQQPAAQPPPPTPGHGMPAQPWQATPAPGFAAQPAAAAQGHPGAQVGHNAPPTPAQGFGAPMGHSAPSAAPQGQHGPAAARQGPPGGPTSAGAAARPPGGTRRPRPAAAPPPKSKTADYLLKGLGLVLVAVISGTVYLLLQPKPHSDPSDRADRPGTTEPSTGNDVEELPYEFATVPQGERSYSGVGCVDHSYGQVKQFFQDHTCTELTQLLYTTTHEGEGVAVSLVAVRFDQEETASALNTLTTQDGTGNVNDLLTEGVRIEGGPSDLYPGAGYASEQRGDTLLISESTFYDNREDPTSKAVLQGISAEAIKQYDDNGD